MKNIRIFDPALCCSSGVCGGEIDQQLVNFSANVEWAKQNDAQLARFNLAQEPMAFASNALVKGILTRSGEAALPLTLVDGEVALAVRYPTRAELSRWMDCESAAAEKVSSTGDCCPGELREIDAVASQYARRYALVPLLKDEPIGIDRLMQLAANSPSANLNPKEN